MHNKFGLNCEVYTHTNGFRLYVHSTSSDKLIYLNKPYLLPVFIKNKDYTTNNCLI